MVKRAIFWGFVLRLAVAIWNGYFGPSFGAELDAVSFHKLGVAYSHDLVLDEFRIGWIYSYFLGLVYFLTSPEVFWGSLLSCFAWLQSAVLLKKTMALMAFDKDQAGRALWVYALLPSSILFTSVTLREAYQLLFVNLALYGAAKLYVRRSLSGFWWAALATVGMGILHGGLFALGVFMTGFSLALPALRNKSISMRRLLAFAPVVLVVLVIGFSVFAKFSYNVEDGVSAAVESYQQGGVSTVARANYKTDIQLDAGLGFLLWIPVSFLQYLFEPMPWRVGSIADLALLSENVLRGWLIWTAYVRLRRAPATDWVAVFAFVSFVVAELIWSLGTVNWGTAARHHIPSFGLLLVATYAVREQARKKRRRRLLIQRVAQ